MQDLNVDPILPFDDATFDAVTCCVSIDYLIRPIEVFDEVARVLRPGGVFVVTFSNRCFPTKAIRAWLAADDRQRCSIVATYFAIAGGFGPPTVQLRNPVAPATPSTACGRTRCPMAFASGPPPPATRRSSATCSTKLCSAPTVSAPFPCSILGEPSIARHHESFGSRPGDVGRIADDRHGVAIGAAWLRRVEGFGYVDADTPELGIAVVPARRNRGVGTALLRSLLDAVPRVSLSVDRRNPAMRLYADLGFETVRTDGEDSVVMLYDGGLR